MANPTAFLLPFAEPGDTGVATTASTGVLLGPVLAEVQGVCVAFNSTTLAVNPQWQRLDDPAGPFVVTGWTINRGRAYELDRTDTGRATISLIDTTGDFDPTNASSFFYNKLDPLKQAAIALQNPVSGAWFTLFRGFVDEIDCEVDATETFTRVDISLVDAFDLLAVAEAYPGAAGQTVPAASAGNVYYQEQTVLQRLNTTADDMGWPVEWRDFFTGNVNVQEVVYPPRTSYLAIFQDVADAEFPGVANLYMSRDGKLTFHGRYARFRPAVVQYGIDTWKVGDRAAVDASPTDTAAIAGMAFTRGKTNLINSALATPQNISDAAIAGQLSQDATSITSYGTRSVSFENLLTSTPLDGSGRTAVQETKLFANYYKANYATPRNRVRLLRFRSIPSSATGGSAMWRFLCNVEISDKVSVTTNHPGNGGFTNEEFYVEGIRYRAVPHPQNHVLVDLEVDVSPVGYYTTEPA